jgi:hypothetical protein
LTDNYDENFWNINSSSLKYLFDDICNKPIKERVEEEENIIIKEDTPIETELPPLNENIFECCSKCKKVKSKIKFDKSHLTICKDCMRKSHQEWLDKNPNAKLGEELRRKIKKGEDIELLTELSPKKFKQWMEYTKQFYIPRGYKGKIDLEHQYPLSKYDLNDEENVAFCFNWKHLRYMTHEDNLRKGNKDPTPKDKFKQAVIVVMFMNGRKMLKC